MEHNMILSASGWRKVFCNSGEEQDSSPEIGSANSLISQVAADTFFDYLVDKTKQDFPVIAIGTDTRPTGKLIANAMIRALINKNAIIQFLGITAAPEIMAYSKKLDGFIYISASHNPIGHNGMKFGINDGGVLTASENAILTKEFLKKLNDEKYLEKLTEECNNCPTSKLNSVYNNCESSKYNAIKTYSDFMNETISDTSNIIEQNKFFSLIDDYSSQNKIGIVCDFNGSARTASIDKEFFTKHNINFYSINSKPGEIVHEIIPEAENLVYVAKEMERLHSENHHDVVLGYMPDCDGDRGNIVYWDEKQNKSIILKAQEVFSLSVLAELTFSLWKNKNNESFKQAVVVNCPTSMRINEIAEKLGAKIFRAEVGEANVVNLSREIRNSGYTVRILGEGSNGGTITYPSSVRDPLNTLFAILKLLILRDNNGLFNIWCDKLNIKYNGSFTLSDVLLTIPCYTTTGVSENRAILKIKQTNHSILKRNFQKNFEEAWKKNPIIKKYGFTAWECVITNGTKETRNVKDFSLSEKGGLKIIFYKGDNNPVAFIWMRGSGTEPVFRVMCDVKGNEIEEEKELLEFETMLLQKSDI
jgi:phosphoglucomutase